MSEAFHSISRYLDDLTGISGALGYFIIISALIVGYFSTQLMNSTTTPPWTQPIPGRNHEEEQQPDPPRNFTRVQLRHFDGSFDESSKEERPVYLSISGIVFDVTDGKDFYGPGGPYAAFAGRECGVALAKMSFDEDLLDDVDGCQTLSAAYQSELEGWIQKFKYQRMYPIRGRLIPDHRMPDPDRVLSLSELRECDGTQHSVPEGYGTAPIYIGAGSEVFDVSFGGVSFYGPGGPYHIFAGRDASRALALMSLNPEDMDNISLDGVTEKQIQTMNDWIKTFRERKRYPVVGRLSK